MKKRVAGILIFIALLLIFAACSGERPSDSPDGQLSTAPESEAPPGGSASSGDLTEDNEAMTMDDFEFLPPGSYVPAEWNDWQENSPGLVWEHLEYRTFGDTSDFFLWSGRVSYAPDGVTASYLLPANCYASEGVIFFSGGFEHSRYIDGLRKIGYAPINFYTLGEDETLAQNGYFSVSDFARDHLTGEEHALTETADNLPDSYLLTERFARYIRKAHFSDSKANLLRYVIKSGERLTSMYFLVSPRATAEDLKVYDFIASSVEIDFEGLEDAPTPHLEDAESAGYELLPPGSYRPGEWNDWQEDPTMNSDDSYFLNWGYAQHRAFGDPAKFEVWEIVKKQVNSGEVTLWDEPEILLTCLLPPNCLIRNGIIDFDAGFVKAPIKIGSGPSSYYVLKDTETTVTNEWASFESFTKNQMADEKYVMVETKENQVGGYYRTPRFIRYIGRIGSVKGKAQMYDLCYVISLDEKRLVTMNFHISAQATAKELEIYDYIAGSVKIAS